MRGEHYEPHTLRSSGCFSNRSIFYIVMDCIGAKMKYVITLLLTLSACSPFPTQSNRDAFYARKVGHISFDTSNLNQTHKRIFTDAEPIVNDLIKGKCFETNLSADFLEIAQGDTHEWVRENLRTLALVRAYIVSQTRTIKIEVVDDTPGAMAQTSVGGDTIVFSAKWLSEGHAMRYISEVTTHEVMHALGFGHNKNESNLLDKKYSVPYRAGAMASGICYVGDGL